MNSVRLELRAPVHERLDLAPLIPDRLGELSATEIGNIPLQLGAHTVETGELFRIEVQASAPEQAAAQLEIHGSTHRFDAIGEAMHRGRIEVFGDAGAGLGRRMRGGQIRVRGSCGAFAATGFAGGRLVIEGDAGDFLGGAEPGLRRGMQGGRVIVHGRAGERAGDHLRRGIIFIAGGAGAYCGARMLAGTLAILGPVGPGLGFGMRRGSIVLDRAPPRLPPTFNDGGETHLGFLQLWARAWREDPDIAEGFLPRSEAVQRWVGDLAVDGRGEILLLNPGGGGS